MFIQFILLLCLILKLNNRQFEQFMRIAGFRQIRPIETVSQEPKVERDEDFEELNRYRMTDEQEAEIEELRNLNAR